LWKQRKATVMSQREFTGRIAACLAVPHEGEEVHGGIPIPGLILRVLDMTDTRHLSDCFLPLPTIAALLLAAPVGLRSLILHPSKADAAFGSGGRDMAAAVLAHASGLQAFVVAAGFVDDTLAAELFPAVGACTQLRYLNVSHNRASTGSVVRKLAVALDTCRELRGLCVGNSIGMGVASLEFFTAIGKLPNLSRLDVGGNILGAAQMVHLAAAVAALPQLRALNVSYIAPFGLATEEYLVPLLTALAGSSMMKELVLRGTDLSEKYTALLATAVGGMVDLRVLDLGYCYARPVGRAPLFAAVKRCARLRRLVVRHCMRSPDYVADSVVLVDL
jgi:hypothetical protein